MEIIFKSGALEDIEFWKQSGNKKIQSRINDLLLSLSKNPERGIGKPRKLKGNLAGYWSRRINDEHRIVYKIEYQEKIISIFSLKGHY
ncbi:MAG TPA: Txe/YoeB family addiction module toxin [Prolixibacteraceae bacterium]|nr:Txe/YoeB family addiction module toxin [Prolixibacteraceae bacterium]HPS12847.1 Txe/YoeB family addiction module toxin [Prolixibacteraceae bacterium]